VSPVRYELGVYIKEDGIIHSHRRVNLKSEVLQPCYQMFLPIRIMVQARYINTVTVVWAQRQGRGRMDTCTASALPAAWGYGPTRRTDAAGHSL
jgi:hypothetical protein